MIAILLAVASLFPELHWRPIGPIRGGRTKAASGVPQRPGTFYIGAVDGGVFRTDDYGRTWTPIFDDQPTGSIGALAVAPSNPDVLYVGSGEGLQRPDLSTGDGLYKSLDAGKTWRHLGLRDAQQIPQIAVDPGDPQRLFVAVLGHPYGPNQERGIFRSTDGGETFQKVLYKDEDTGGADVLVDPSDSHIVYAVLWEARQGPWENGEFSGPGSGLYKSVDGGTTWRPLTRGLPDFIHDGLGRIGIGIAPSRTSRLFATVQTKQGGFLYRSDDAGESWARICDDPRVAERADDFAEVKVDPQDPDTVYTASVVTWKSTDGGKTFAAFRGAPGGDDYHRIWIHPKDSRQMLIAADQGAIITVDGGATWSSWYNQPTAAMFHVTADNAFPYRLCGGQQDSGSACVPSRGPDGAITFRDWHPAGLEEYGYAAPDPLDPDIVYGGKISRWDRRTGQDQDVSPVLRRSKDYRVVRTQPVIFSPLDPHLLYFASNRLWKTTTGGRQWTAISPDLTRKQWEMPANVGKYRGTPKARVTQRGVIYAVAPSPVDRGTIWAGTDDGLIHLTRDGGKSWQDVTPKQLVPWAKVSIIDAGRRDARTAYAAIDTMRLDDMRPHLLRTHDGGKTWTEIVNGLPGGAIARVVREDPVRPGLLFCGTEQAVYVSFDDGDHWQPLRLNMPATSIRDLIVKDGDLAVATHGRGFWILDDIEPLREIDDGVAAREAHLFRPATALRVRWNTNTDTPLPPDEPMAPNPPDGAVIDYWLPSGVAGPVVLEIVDAAGNVVRRFSSSDPVPEPNRNLAVYPYAFGTSWTVTEPASVPGDQGNVPWYWIRPLQIVSARAGAHRFVWDLHYQPLGGRVSFPISAVPRDTPRNETSPWVMPGTYTVRLNAGGQTLTQPLVVKMDPRVKTSEAGLKQQFDLSMQIYKDLVDIDAALGEARSIRDAAKSRAAAESKKSAKAEEPRFEGSVARLAGISEEGGDEEFPRRGRSNDTLTGVASSLRTMLEVLQAADVAPTTQSVAAATEAHASARRLLDAFATLKKTRRLKKTTNK